MRYLRAALFASALAVAAGPAAAETEVTLASSVPNTGINKIVVDTFKEELARTAPDLELEIFLDSALGGERELVDLVKLGETDIHMGVIHASQYFPELDATLVPYLFPDYASVRRFLEGSVGEQIEQALEERGNAVLLGTYYQGERWTTSNKPFATLDELKGVKIRMPEIPLWIEIWSGLGATITPMPSNEVFSALQTGVIDAQENMLSNILGRRIHEVQEYLIGTRHQVSYVTIMANKDFWEDELTDEQREAIQNAVDKATAAGTAAAEAENKQIVEEIVASGVELIEPKPEFRQEAMPVIEKAARGVLAEGIYEEAVKAIRQN